MDTSSQRWGLWKTRIKSGGNALLLCANVIRYAPIEHFYRSIIQGGIPNGSRTNQDTARSAPRREARIKQQAGCSVPRFAGRSCGKRNQEEWRIRRSGLG